MKIIHRSLKPFVRFFSCVLVAIAMITQLPVPIPKTAQAATSCPGVYAALPAWLTDAINANMNFYRTASSATGVPWEMLAAIHYRETSFSHSNPANGQGIFQFVNGDGGPYPPGQVSDANFQTQLNYMASRIQSDYVYRGTLSYAHRQLQQNEPDDFRVQDTLYSYNGRSSQYAQQGTQYGFNASTQPYEGSPYVMNMFDCARVNMGLITRDYGSIDGIDTRYGAFTLYARLKGDVYWQGRYDFLGTNTRLNLPGCPQSTNTFLVCLWKLEQLGTGAPTLASTLEQRDLLVTYGYRLNGTSFFANSPAAAQPGNIPVYQLIAPDKSYFYTTDPSEKTALIASYGFSDNGVGFYADPPAANSGYPVTRLYSPTIGRHIWIKDPSEKQSYLNAGYQNEGVSFASISTAAQEQAPPTGKKLVYRFYVQATKEHFWTTDLTERDNMISAGYSYERVAWQSSSNPSDLPVYRLYCSAIAQHLYTTDVNEKNSLIASGIWSDEGTSFYVSKVPSNSPVFRLYSPALKVHHLTMDNNERSVLGASGNWRDEAVAWYQP